MNMKKMLSSEEKKKKERTHFTDVRGCCGTLSHMAESRGGQRKIEEPQHRRSSLSHSIEQRAPAG